VGELYCVKIHTKMFLYVHGKIGAVNHATSPNEWKYSILELGFWSKVSWYWSLCMLNFVD